MASPAKIQISTRPDPGLILPTGQSYDFRDPKPRIVVVLCLRMKLSLLNSSTVFTASSSYLTQSRFFVSFTMADTTLKITEGDDETILSEAYGSPTVSWILHARQKRLEDQEAELGPLEEEIRLVYNISLNCA